VTVFGAYSHPLGRFIPLVLLPVEAQIAFVGLLEALCCKPEKYFQHF
jgi:hypothetical protein